MFLPKLSSGALRTPSARTMERGAAPSQAYGVNCHVNYTCTTMGGGSVQGTAAGSGTDLSRCCMNAGSSAYGNCQAPNQCTVSGCTRDN